MFEAKIEGDVLKLTIPLQKPTPSGSGKTLVVASTHGNVTLPVKVQGQHVLLGLNAYIKRPEPAALV